MSLREKLHHQISGPAGAPRVVFLHGLMGSSVNWRTVIKALADSYECLAFDQRGHGRSWHPSSGYTAADYARDLHELLDELGWHRVVLVGHSLGARNALYFASHYPDRAAALVVEDIGPDASDAGRERTAALLELVPVPFPSRRVAQDFFRGEFMKRLPPGEKQPQVLASFFMMNIDELPDGRADWRFHKPGILQSLAASQAGDMWDEWRGLRVPSLVVRGAESQHLSPAVYEGMLKEQPQAVGRIIPQAGHWVHFDQTEAFVAVLREFLDHLAQPALS